MRKVPSYVISFVPPLSSELPFSPSFDKRFFFGLKLDLNPHFPFCPHCFFHENQPIRLSHLSTPASPCRQAPTPPPAISSCYEALPPRRRRQPASSRPSSTYSHAASNSSGRRPMDESAVSSRGRRPALPSPCSRSRRGLQQSRRDPASFVLPCRDPARLASPAAVPSLP